MGDEVPAEGSGGAPASGSAQLKRMNTGIATLDVDDLISKLLSVRGRGPNAQVNLPEQDIQSLCLVARDIFLDQPALLQLATPIKICGDIHGQYHDLLRLFDIGGHPPMANYLFLGDYVDRGKRSLETISLLLCYKVKYPQNFFIMRGNHESASINKMYGFYDECKRRYSTKLWKTFTDCFNCLPIAAVVDDKIFCAHGGLSPELTEMDQINRISRPTDVPDTGLLCDLLWSDPDREIIGWGENDRGVSFTFGEDIVKGFLAKHDLDLVCRAHQVVEDGYEFFARRRLVTLFSAPNYCGEFDNAGAMMSVDEALMCSFQILQSNESAQRERYQRKSSGANRGWLTNGPVGAARLSSMEIPDSAVPEEDDPLLVPVLLSAPKSQSSEITYDATGGGLDGGVVTGSAPVVDVSDGAGEFSGPTLTTPPPVMAPEPTSQAVRRRRSSRQRSIDSSSNTSKEDGDSPAAFVPLPSTSSSTSSSSSSSSRSVKNDATRNRRKMVSPPPFQALGVVAVGSGALAASESGGAPAIGLGLLSAPAGEEERVRRVKHGPTTPSPPKIVRPIAMTSLRGSAAEGQSMTSLRGSAAESQSMTSSGEPTAEGGEVVMTAMTSFAGGPVKLLSRAVEVAQRIREASDDRAVGDGVQSPERQRGDSGDDSRYPLPLLASPLSSTLVTRLPDTTDGVSRGGGSRPSSTKSKKRDTHKPSAGGSSSGRRHRHSSHSADESLRSTTPSNSGSEARRRRRTKLVIATPETSQKPGDDDRHGNSNHNHMSDGDVPRKHGPLLVNGSITTPRIVSPSSAGNGTVRSSNGHTSFGGTVRSSNGHTSFGGTVRSSSNGNTSFGGTVRSSSNGKTNSVGTVRSSSNDNTSFGGTVSSSTNDNTNSSGTVSKSRRFYPRKPSVVAIESMSDSSGAGIPRGLYEGVATTSSTSGGARKGNTSISEQMSEVYVLPSDEGISSAECGEGREDGEESQQGLDPVDRSVKQIATAAAAAAAAAEAEADGRDIALRVDKHQKQQQEKDHEAREDYGVGSDVGGDVRRDREAREKGSRKEGEDGRRLREKRRARSRARKEKEAAKGKEATSLPSSITVGAADEAYAEYGFLTPPTKTGNPNMDAGDHSGVSTSEAFIDSGKENGGTFDKRGALARRFMVSDSSTENSSSMENSNSSMENSNSSMENSSGIMSEEKVEEEDDEQQRRQRQQHQGTSGSLGVDSVGVESPGTGTSTHSVETRVSHQSSFADSFVSSTDSDRKRTRRGVLGVVKKGLGSVWEKVTADHPQPLPVERTLTKEEQKALHLREEKERLNDWSTNSVAEQHQMAEVLKVEEERVWV